MYNVLSGCLRNWGTRTQDAFGAALAMQQFLLTTEEFLSAAIEDDRCRHLDAQAEELTQARDLGLPKQMWGKASHILQFGGRKAKIPVTFPYATTDDGKPLTTEGEVADNLQLHFARVEKGCVTDEDAIEAHYNGMLPLLSDDTPRDINLFIPKATCPFGDPRHPS